MYGERGGDMKLLLLTTLISLSACVRISERERAERRAAEQKKEEVLSEFAGTDIQLNRSNNWWRFENKEVVCYEANKSGVWCYRKDQQ
jgi:hypothetical protein